MFTLMLSFDRLQSSHVVGKDFLFRFAVGVDRGFCHVGATIKGGDPGLLELDVIGSEKILLPRTFRFFSPSRQVFLFLVCH